MPAVALDTERLAQLRVFSDAELRQITADVIEAVTAQLQGLHEALASRDLRTAADAAHRGRNEALLVGARELCEAFSSLEQAARGGDSSQAEKAAQAAGELWPATRKAIARIHGPMDQGRGDGGR
jgi:hypothetical protein